MGFRKDGWATCWDVDVKSDTMTQVRLSTSRKDKQTGEYVQDFSGFVAFVGTAAAKKAAALKEKDRIKLGDVEVTTKYDKDKDVTYTNFKCYNFDVQSEAGTTPAAQNTEPQPSVDEGVDGDRLPW